MRKLLNNKGLTLIELLAVLSMLGVVLATTVGFLSNTLKSYINDDAQWQIQQDARFAIQSITKDVRAANSISVSKDDINKYILDMKDCNQIPITIKWELDDGNQKVLYRIKNGVKNRIIENVYNIVFDYSNNILNITLVTQKPGIDNKFTISTKIYSRLSPIIPD